MSNKTTLQVTNADLNEILSIVRGLPMYTDTSDATATAEQILKGYTAYVNGTKLTGTMSEGITPEMFGYTKFETGTYVPTSDTLVSTPITHGLGVAPRLIIIEAQSTIPKAYGTYYLVDFMCLDTNNGTEGLKTWMGNGGYNKGMDSLTTTSTSFYLRTSSTGPYYKKGVSYKYILMG